MSGAGSFLELRVPPPAVALAAAALMWGIALALPSFRVEVPGARWIAGGGLLAGILIAGAGLMAFRQARTTVNPMRPEETTMLVTTGVYAWTRNPMYLGWLPMLAGWAAWLENPGALVVVPLFMLYIARLQIVPEERALGAKFGAAFDAYRRRVRRWL